MRENRFEKIRDLIKHKAVASLNKKIKENFDVINDIKSQKANDFHLYGDSDMSQRDLKEFILICEELELVPKEEAMTDAERMQIKREHLQEFIYYVNKDKFEFPLGGEAYEIWKYGAQNMPYGYYQPSDPRYTLYDDMKHTLSEFSNNLTDAQVNEIRKMFYDVGFKELVFAIRSGERELDIVKLT